MTAEAPAGRIADAEFFDDGEIPQSAAFQVAYGFRTAMELKLIKGRRPCVSNSAAPTELAVNASSCRRCATL